MLGQYDAGLAMMTQSLADGETIGQYVGRHTFLIELADALRYAGQPAQGLRRLAEAQQWAQTMPQGYHKEAARHRVHGELLLALASENAEADAEACFQRALTVARRQQAKSWELRASLSLSRLWQQQGKHQHAYNLLAPVYAGFTEGFDTLDLQEAQALLQDLASRVL
jgi:predicted ATPase